jgi:hypothetical protein
MYQVEGSCTELAKILLMASLMLVVLRVLNHKRDGLRYRLIEELTDGGIGCRLIGCPSIFLLSEGLSSFLLVDGLFLLIVLVDYMGLKDEWLIDYCR